MSLFIQCISCSLRRFNYFKPLLFNSSYVSVQRVENYYLGSAFLDPKHHKLGGVPSIRCYAKGKDKKKDKGKKTTVEVNETELAEVVNLDSLKKGMERSIELLKNEYVKHLSLRSSAGSIEMLPVSLDEKEYTLQELAQIVRKNPKMLVVNMSVFPQAIPAALKALQASGMNLNPQQDGTTLYIPVPAVTKEHRETLAKNAKTLFTKCKDGIRDTQMKHTKSLKRKEGISVDIVRNMEQQVVSIADQYITQAIKIMESKQQELIGVKE